MKILVLGWYYSSNLGDAVICECVAALLRSNYPGAVVAVRDIAGRTGFAHRESVDLKQRESLRKRQLLRSAVTRLGWDKQLVHEQWMLNEHRAELPSVAEGEWDLAVFAGGQLFMDGLALYVEAACREFSRRQIPVIFNACGTGPLVSPAIRARLAAVLKAPNVRLVSCRDGVELVNRWCGESVAVPTDDAALWTDWCYGIKAVSSDTVGLGVLCPDSLDPDKTAAFWRRLIRELDVRNIRWKMFTNGHERDMAFARTLLDGRPEAEFLAPAPEKPEELVALIGSFRSIIGFRLHSHIIAASLGIPSVAMIWDQKLPRFFEKMGLPGRCFTIRASGQEVVAALQMAEQTPPSPEMITERRVAARKLLLDAVDQIVRGEK